MTKGVVTTIVFALSLFSARQVLALPAGTLDSGFSGDGLATTAAGDALSEARDVIQQQDGKKLVAVGRSNNGVLSFDRFAVVRYLSNGTLDPEFGGDGVVNTPVGNGNAAAFAVIQTGAKWVVVGQALNSSAQPTTDFAVVRYNPDGSLDAGFSNDGIVLTPPHSTITSDQFQDGAHAVIETPDHDLVVAGFSGTALDSDFALVRYNPDGSLDTNFSPVGEAGKVTTNFGNGNDVAYALLREESNGKLVVAGFSHNGTNDDFAIARYNADGTLDLTFNSNGIQRTPVSIDGEDHGLSLIRQADGKYVVAGYTSRSGNEDFALVRYLPDGHLDASFNGNGIVRTPIGTGNDRAQKVIELPDGKLLVVGYTQVGTNDFRFALARYNRNGSLDTTFSGDGKLGTSFGVGTEQAQAFAAVEQANHRVVLAGAVTINTNSVKQQRFALARYHFSDYDDDGVLDYQDNCPFVANGPNNSDNQKDQDHDGIGDACDNDRDGDGVPNNKDAFPDDPTETKDNDGDGKGDNADPDDDNDCILDANDPFPFDANLLNRFNGEKKGDFFGYSVANAGDIDKDGIDDLIIGAPRHDKKVDKKTVGNAGTASVYSGKFSNPPTLNALSILTGDASGDQFGSAVAGAGDVDGDAVPDIVVGAPKADVTGSDGKKRKDAGVAVIFDGQSIKDGQPMELFRVEGEAAGDNLGNAVGFVKDIGGDGRDEIIVGASKADKIDGLTGKKIKDAGAVYIYSYAANALSSGVRTLVHKFDGASKGDGFGYSVASGDVDKDGKADAIIGAYGVNVVNGSGKKLQDAGRVFVYGLDDFVEIFHQDGGHAGDKLGFAVASVDIDGDGFTEVLAGAPREDYIQDATANTPKKTFSDAGIVRVYSGDKTQLYRAHNKEPQKSALFGSALSDGGPLAGGEHAFIVGAYKYDPIVKGKKLSNAGKVSLHQGSNGDEQFSFDGHGKDNYFGFAVSASGDRNGDSFSDILVGGYQDDPIINNKKLSNAGIVELLTGEDPGSACKTPP